MSLISLKRCRFGVIFQSLLLLILAKPLLVTAAPVISVVDTGGTNVVGKFASQAIVGGNPAIAYYDETAGDLYYVRATNPNGTAWGTPVVVDTNGNVGFGASLEVINGNPAISYREYVSSALLDTSSRLKYVRATDANGSAWGTPVVLDNASGQLTLDTTNSTGEFATSLKLVNGNPAVAYFKGSVQAALGDNGGRNFQFVRATDTNGATWGTPLNVTPNGPSQGYYLRMAIVNGVPLVVDLQGSQGGMERWRANDANGGSWANGVVTPDQAGGSFPLYTGANLSLAMVAGQPALSYYDITLADLRFTRSSNTNGTAWPAAAGPSGAAQTIVDSTGDVGRFSSLQIFNGFPAISYYDKSNGDLKYAAATAADGSAWGTPQIIDSTGDVGLHTSQQILTNGLPGIAYFDATGGNLKYAVVNPTINVQQPVGTNLVNGSGSVNFTNGAVLTFAITNSGRINLTLGNFTIDGVNAADFTVGLPGTNALVPGAATTFTVTFTTASPGSRTATLHLANSDITATPFNIALVGTGTINVATISLTNLNQAYTGAACPVTAVTTPTNLAVILTYNGSPNAPTDAGSYTVVGTLNDTNYVANPVTNTLMISPISVTVVLADLNQNYNGSARRVRGFTSPGYFPVTLTYNGSPDAPTNAGSYTVVGSISSPNYTGSPVTNTLVINKLTNFPMRKIFAWGYNGSGQCNVTNFDHPKAIAAFGYNSMALNDSGAVNTWGDIGPAPQPAPWGTNLVKTIAVGGLHALVTVDYIGYFDNNPVYPFIFGWGDNSRGQLNGFTIPLQNISLPAPQHEGRPPIAAGEFYSLGIYKNNSSTIFGRGDDYYGQSYSSLPNGNGRVWQALAAGNNHALALDDTGRVYAWGFNLFGQTNVPSDLTNVVAIAAAGNSSLALKNDGTLSRWGYNPAGLFGANNPEGGILNIPAGLTNVVGIAQGNYHALAIKADGQIIAWGDNTAGQCNVPAGLTNAVAVAAGELHSVAIGIIDTPITVTIGNLNQVYNGTARSVTASSSPMSCAMEVTYNGSLNAPTNPGNYAVIARVNDPIYTASATNTLVVSGPNNINLSSTTVTGGGLVQFTFTNQTGFTYSVLSTTNLNLPLTDWSVVGTATEISPGSFQFTDPQGITNAPQRFYRIRTP